MLKEIIKSSDNNKLLATLERLALTIQVSTPFISSMIPVLQPTGKKRARLIGMRNTSPETNYRKQEEKKAKKSMRGERSANSLLRRRSSRQSVYSRM